MSPGGWARWAHALRGWGTPLCSLPGAAGPGREAEPRGLAGGGKEVLRSPCLGPKAAVSILLPLDPLTTCRCPLLGMAAWPRRLASHGITLPP